MTRYQTLFGVEVRHPYFADGRARALRFVPDPATRRFLDRHGVITRSDDAALQLIAGDDRLDALWDERQDEQGAARVLQYALQSTELEAAYYTQGNAGVVYLSNGQGELIASAESAKAAPAISGATPLGTIRLPLSRGATSRTDWAATLGTLEVLTLPVRATIWKYLLLGDWRDYRLKLVDPQAQIAFSDGAIERLPDHRDATVFRSQSAIEYREQPPQRFQLRDGASTPEKVLIKRLPAAAPRGLRRETDGGAASLVSEIFVHR